MPVTPPRFRLCSLATVEGRIASLIADSAYGVSVSQAAAARQHDPSPAIVMPPRSSSVLDADSPTIRDCHVQLIAEKGGMAWQKAID
jgi:hypothetical protein